MRSIEWWDRNTNSDACIDYHASANPQVNANAKPQKHSPWWPKGSSSGTIDGTIGCTWNPMLTLPIRGATPFSVKKGGLHGAATWRARMRGHHESNEMRVKAKSSGSLQYVSTTMALWYISDIFLKEFYGVHSQIISPKYSPNISEIIPILATTPNGAFIKL